MRSFVGLLWLDLLSLGLPIIATARADASRQPWREPRRLHPEQTTAESCPHRKLGILPHLGLRTNDQRFQDFEMTKSLIAYLLPPGCPDLCSDSSYSVVSRRGGDSVRRAKVSAEHGRLFMFSRLRRWSQLVDLNLGPAVYESLLV